MAVDSPQPDDVPDEDLSEHARPRKRTRRACDKCSNSRTRCNGECPCRRCVDYGYTCRYNREVKKRGRAPISISSDGRDLPSKRTADSHNKPVHKYENRQDDTTTHQQPHHSGANHSRTRFGDGGGVPAQGVAGNTSTTSPTTTFHAGGLQSNSQPALSSATHGPNTTSEIGHVPPSPGSSGHTAQYFAHSQRAQSYSEPSIPVSGGPRLHSSHSNHSAHSQGLSGPREALPSPSTGSTHQSLPGISHVPLSANSSGHRSAYQTSLPSSSTAYGAGVNVQMQLASVLDSTAAMDHSGMMATSPSTNAHQHQQSSPTLSRLAHQQAGTSPGGAFPPMGGGHHAGSVHGAPTGSTREGIASDESMGYPSPANGSVTGGYGSSHRPSVSFGVESPSALGNMGHQSGREGSHSSQRHANGRGSFSTVTGVANGRVRIGSVADPGGATSGGGFPEIQRVSSLYKAPSADCRYACLMPVLPYIADIIPASVACDLLDVYLTEPGSSLFRCASPYILTRIFRKKSLLHPTNPRPTTPALLATMLWCAAQTADIVLLHVPGSRSKITNALYELSTSLISRRDPDRWRRIHGGLRVENDQSQTHYAEYFRNLNGGDGPSLRASDHLPTTTATNEPGGVIDDVLTFVLLSIAVSGGDFKSDCFKWWNKAIRLALALGLHREDERCSASVSPCANPLCSCRREHEDDTSLSGAEAREERRRVFWLIYCLDRHLALSFNSALYIPDSYCELYTPLPETVWEELDTIPHASMPERVIGPPTVVTGTGFFEYFLPLMAILGDIIEVHHRRLHPRLGRLDDSPAVAVISEELAACERSLDRLALDAEPLAPAADPIGSDYLSATAAGGGGVIGGSTVASTSVPVASTPGPHIKDLVTGIVDGTRPVSTGSQNGSSAQDGVAKVEPGPTTQSTTPSGPPPFSAGSAGNTPPDRRQHRSSSVRDRSRLQLVMAYSTHILHVLHVLLHGKWDAISMLDDDDDWITSARFNDCAASAIAASQAVSRILRHDPELTFMPYLFGIYLLHGSFILLLFADRMPQLGGPNQSVEQACETIVRAHEVCVVTLSTEFQKNFRKVLRSTLYSVRGSSPTEWEEHKARRRALSLYRWTRGAKGLGL